MEPDNRTNQGHAAASPPSVIIISSDDDSTDLDDVQEVTGPDHTWPRATIDITTYNEGLDDFPATMMGLDDFGYASKIDGIYAGTAGSISTGFNVGCNLSFDQFVHPGDYQASSPFSLWDIDSGPSNADMQGQALQFNNIPSMSDERYITASYTPKGTDIEVISRDEEINDSHNLEQATGPSLKRSIIMMPTMDHQQDGETFAHKKQRLQEFEDVLPQTDLMDSTTFEAFNTYSDDYSQASVGDLCGPSGLNGINDDEYLSFLLPLEVTGGVDSVDKWIEPVLPMPEQPMFQMSPTFSSRNSTPNIKNSDHLKNVGEEATSGDWETYIDFPLLPEVRAPADEEESNHKDDSVPKE